MNITNITVKKIGEDKYVGYAYPVTEECRMQLQEAILGKYYETV